MELKENKLIKSEKAIGDIQILSKSNQICIEIIIQLTNKIPIPKQGDWLSEHKEVGQTLDQYSKKPRKIQKNKNLSIYIVPLEKDIDVKFQEQLKLFALPFFLGLKVKFLDTPDLQQWKIASRGKDEDKQYNASNILDKLQTIMPKDAYCLIGIMMTDIYPRDSWNYVFGLASLTEKVGVFSFARYNDKFWDKNAVIDKEKIIYRSCKVMCHELCHQFGIKHCIYYSCLMNGSNNLEESSSKPFQLCPVCLRKLQLALDFDIQERFQYLAEACQVIGGNYFKIDQLFYNQMFKMVNEKLNNGQKLLNNQQNNDDNQQNIEKLKNDNKNQQEQIIEQKQQQFVKNQK